MLAASPSGAGWLFGSGVSLGIVDNLRVICGSSGSENLMLAVFADHPSTLHSLAFSGFWMRVNGKWPSTGNAWLDCKGNAAGMRIRILERLVGAVRLAWPRLGQNGTGLLDYCWHALARARLAVHSCKLRDRRFV